MADNEQEAIEELKGLSALYSLLCYAMREVSNLGAPCPEAANAIADAQAAIWARIAILQAKMLEGESIDTAHIVRH